MSVQTNFSELSEAQLSTVAGGCCHRRWSRGRGGNSFGGLNLNRFLRGNFTSQMNISIIVISNSTINGNVTIIPMQMNSNGGTSV